MCWELFDEQPREYRESVLPPSVRARLAVEAGSPQGWHRYVGDHGDVLGVDRFGASAPGGEMLERYGFRSEEHTSELQSLMRTSYAVFCLKKKKKKKHKHT